MSVYFTSTRPTARKPHRCDQCGRWIAVGERYRRQGYVFDGRIGSTRVCTQCVEFAEALFRLGFEGDEGGWAYLPELESSEVAYVGLSREHDLFKQRWTVDGVLVEYPSEPALKGAGNG